VPLKQSTLLPVPPAQQRPDANPHRVTSEALLGRAGQLLIVHGGREYRLRVTHNGKLILTA
jgi:hemin uptake protein HemP